MENSSDTPRKRGGYYQTYYRENREKRLKATQDSRQRHLQETRDRDAAAKRKSNFATNRYWRLRKEILECLGGQCQLCGFADNRALQIDHINGGGTQDRKLIRSITALRRDVQAYGRDKYQVLCANCHPFEQYERNQRHRDIE